MDFLNEYCAYVEGMLSDEELAQMDEMSFSDARAWFYAWEQRTFFDNNS